MGLMFQPFVRYIDFEGRSRRSEYWLWALFLFVANMAFTIIQYGAIFSMAASSAAGGAATDQQALGVVGAMGIVGLLKLLFWLAVLIPSIAVSVRRFHDTNRTGWWILFPTGVFIVAAILFFTLNGAQFINEMKQMERLSDNSDPQAVIAAVMTILRPLFWILLPVFAAKLLTFVFRVMDGTRGNNRFGPDPKGQGGNINVF